MSKRLIRIRPDDVLSIKIGTEVNAVYQNGKTFFGKLESVSKQFLTMKDTRDSHHQIDLADLYEVVYDLETLKKRTSI